MLEEVLTVNKICRPIGEGEGLSQIEAKVRRWRQQVDVHPAWLRMITGSQVQLEAPLAVEPSSRARPRSVQPLDMQLKPQVADRTQNAGRELGFDETRQSSWRHGSRLCKSRAPLRRGDGLESRATATS